MYLIKTMRRERVFTMRAWDLWDETGVPSYGQVMMLYSCSHAIWPSHFDYNIIMEASNNSVRLHEYRDWSQGSIPLTMAADFMTDLWTTIRIDKALGTEEWHFQRFLCIWMLEIEICDAIDRLIALQSVVGHDTMQHTVSHVVGRGVGQVCSWYCKRELHTVRGCNHTDAGGGVGSALVSSLWHAHVVCLSFCRGWGGCF